MVHTLVYAMMQFVGQLLLTVYSVIIIFGVFTANTDLITVTQQFVTYIADIFSLSGPVCLFATRYAGSMSQPLKRVVKVTTFPCNGTFNIHGCTRNYLTIKFKFKNI